MTVQRALSPVPIVRARPLRQLVLARGWGILCLCTPAIGVAQTLAVGPTITSSVVVSGANGQPGTDAVGGGSCKSGPVPGTAGAAGPSIEKTIPLEVKAGDKPDTLVAVSSSGGAGGAGGNGDSSGQCGKGDFYGQPGGAGGQVTVVVQAGPTTPASGYTVPKTGIVAVSHGGAGGKGGDNTRGKDDYKGGDGGAGGAGGNVHLENAVAVTVTGGIDAMGLVAQSGGGAGGAGGAAVNSANAGNGMPGGAGGDVVLRNTAAITTGGGNAMSAQSIGGFGGDGGVNTKSHSGSGGSGGNGGTLAVDNTGTLVVGKAGLAACSDSVTTNCNPAGGFGLAAQSVGGGGGHAGASAGLHILGAEGGAAGHAGSVVVNNTGAISVNGPSGTGLFAQAIGGGGGSGGMAISSGSKTTAVGGAGGAGGDGGAVTVISWNSLCTGTACASTGNVLADNSTAGGAIALVAQSIGGGGGVGGFAKAKGRATIFGNSSATAVGGTGGSGGIGAKVWVTQVGHLKTAEISSPGLLAQSIGGGGGSAGGAIAYATAVVGDASAVSHGGAGGGGGNAGNVLVNCNTYSQVSSGFSPCVASNTLSAPNANYQITTAGLGSPGLVAQSIGGGGGAGGYAMSLAGSVMGSQAFGFGGSGGAGGTGGSVFASSNGQSISTGGAQSPGLLAQSIGGGGGSGGSTIDLSLAYTGSSASVGVGGQGGSGQAAGSVVVHNAGGVVTTAGEGSQGLVAQSIGGGGGNGGSAITLAASGRYAGSLSVGGAGATGGTGGSVTLVNDNGSVDSRYGSGAITTQGAAASALVAQSIGGGGGHGGYSVALSGAEFTAGAASIGGNGGSGNHAGAVNVTNRGALTTQGGGAPVLLAQSIGGGGGSGGHALSGTVAGMLGVSIGIGGAGGTGSNGGAVSVVNTAAIAATSSANGHAPGILAQSIGGGGGNGGFSASGSLSLQGAVSLAVGGGGGNGGSASTVSVDHSGALQTAGAFSPGIQAQSLGGNGGNGGHTLSAALAGGISLAASLGGGGGKGGTGGDIWMNTRSSGPALVTAGDQSPGVVGQSLGGAGGTGGWAVSGSASMAAAPSVSLGGAGGAGGRAGGVHLTTQQAVQTGGQMSPGLVAQSIGGNGGSGGFTAAGSATTIVAMATSVGGQGGTGGQGGGVSVQAQAPITTTGPQSFAILAQSIGGNGGNGGSAVSGSASTGNPSMAVSIGAAGASGANGGTGQNANTVSVIGRGTLKTQGAGSIGVLAQSIGGGGGSGGSTAAFSASASGGDPNSKSMAASVTVGGKGAAGGTGADVTVRTFGAVQTGTPVRSGQPTLGDRAIGVLAQSIGGSGGHGGAAYSNAISGTASVAVAIGGGGGSGSNAGNALLGFDARTYLASNGDLIKAFGNDPARALQHYVSDGFFENRSVNGFNAAQYLANYGDLQNAYGSDLVAATNHFVANGYGEGRNANVPAGSSAVTLALAGGPQTFIDPLTYIASNADLISAYGNDPVNGLLHYRNWGYGEGRATASFNAAQYLANYADLRTAYGSDTMAATLHWITTGYREGRSASAPAGSTPVSPVVLPSVTTFGQQAPGWVAQSIGGGGGHGGAASASATSNQHAASVAVGGYGGGGGDAGIVIVTPSGAISTTGAQSPGVLAQSIGGGGGHGGSASASADGSQGAVQAAGVAAYTGLVGSTVGNATVAVAQKFTKDDGASPSSSANSGGVGASLSIGGAGGLGGKGNTVTLNSTAVVTTLGDLSSGLFAQSVGGGGGHGGSSTSNANGGNSSAAVSLGGSGGTGGDASLVQVRNSGRISTAGTQSLGVFAQSVGGGGGDGGSASSSSTAGGKAAASFGLGGSGGGGGSGGTVSLIHTGSVTTASGHSAGLFAQSVGGGGGNGGAASTAATAPGSADDGKTSASTGSASSAPNNTSNSASAGSVSGNTSKGGAAGADSGYAASLAIGGAGGKAGHGGSVVVQTSGSVITGQSAAADGVHAVAHAPAVFAQSIGGGGGNGGSSSSNADGAKSSVALSLGGLGGVAGNGGSVAVHAGAGSLLTRGHLSSAIVAQSVGGGGGNGGSAASTTGTGSSASVAMGLGGSAGGGGSGGSVVVCGTHNNDGSCGSAMAATLSTTGLQSHGVFAQSVGGGGGSGGSVSTAAKAGDADGGDNSAKAGDGSSSSSATSGVAVAAALGGSGGSGGAGGDVRLSIAGGISTAGAQSAALFAQSVGGGGGVGGSSSSNASSGAHAVSLALGASGGSGGKGGAVSVDAASSATLQTGGALSHGLFAQSVGGGGGLAGSSSSTSADAGNSNVALALGGKAGSGQDGGTVKVNSGASIGTAGFGADAVLAQSIGGGGGSGGSSSSSASAGKAAAALSLGGSGGASGQGGEVSVALFAGKLSTTGEGARGVLAQSVGGGGGSGGSADASTGSGTAKSASLALGGAAGSSGGGAGGKVTVNSSGAFSLNTTGHFASGVLAQSIGGGGGAGGSSVTSANGDRGSYSLTMNLGGAGGKGGAGGNVSVDLRNSGTTIATQGVAAFGVLAQSVGGGGGFGGAASWVNAGSAGSVSGGGILGGTGGDGGAGGSVTLLSDQTVKTAGGLAVGLLAQSVGGGGGVGAAATSTDSGTTFDGTVRLGGNGGGGGAGGSAQLAVATQLATGGVLAHGAVVQSIGGGGGLNLTRAGSTLLGGGGGHAGGLVILSSSAAVQTGGHGAIGLVAQSIGGGGGLSTALGSAFLGGSGAFADAGTVLVCNGWDSSSRCVGDAWLKGSIATRGVLAHGLLAQSIGGGGGAVLSPSNPLNDTLNRSGGLGGKVTVWTAQAISTQAEGAAGLVAQSIGSGGGLIGDLYWAAGSVSHTLAAASTIDKSTGSAVSIDATSGNAAWSTAGINAPVLVAQSIGGGGGYFAHTNVTQASSVALKFQLGATDGSSDSGTVDVKLGTRSISSAGGGSLGVLAQSVAGAGGVFAWAAPSTVAAGTGPTSATISGQLGQSASGSRSFDVNVSGSPTITTSGLHAAGLVAQSVGNGGGVALAAGRPGQVYSGTVRLGATGGADRFSGPVNVQLDGGSISTAGDMAPGLVAQSIAGGGGLSLVQSSTAWLGGAATGAAYPVTVSNKAAITTSGAGSIGLVAQSIGGGGGLAYATEKGIVGGSGSSNNAGGTVLVNSNAPIRTSGVNAFGILAQSIGGGGGAVIGVGSTLTPTLNTTKANAGDVTINVNADITTTGAGAHAIVAQSVAGSGGLVVSGTTTTAYEGKSGTSGVVKVVYASGVTVSVSGAGAKAFWGTSSTDPIVEVQPGARVVGGSGVPAMYFEGPINELVNHGHVGNADGHAGTVVQTVGGDIAIQNRGVLQGNLKLADGARNEVVNHAGAQILHGGTLDLGGSGTLRNDGTLTHGGATGSTTVIDGHLHQGEQGTIALRVDPGLGVTDQVQVSGSATLKGRLQPLLQNAHLVAPGTRSLGAIVSAAGGVDASALALPDTAILDYRLHAEDGQLGFSAHADFSPEGMSEDVQRLGDLLGHAQGEQRVNFRALTARLVSMATPQEVHQAYWELSGAGATTVATVGTRMSTVFGRTLTDRVGAMPAPRPAGQAGHSVWLQALGERHDARYDGAGTADVDARMGGVASGVETRLDARTTVGAALAGSKSTLHMSHGYHATGRGVQMGAYGARDFASRLGDVYVASALSYARHELDTERLFELTGAQFRARMKGHAIGVRGEAGLRTTLPGWGVAPYAALQLQHFVMRAHQEEASAQPHLALNYGRSAFTQARTELGAALDTRRTLRAGEVLTLRGRLAWAHESWTEHRMQAAFQTLGGQPFSVVGLTPVADLAVVSAQAELRLAPTLAVEVSVQGEYGRDTRTRSGTAALRYSW